MPQYFDLGQGVQYATRPDLPRGAIGPRFFKKTSLTYLASTHELLADRVFSGAFAKLREATIKGSVPNIKLKECHPRCVYQNYNGLIINNGNQKHNYICKYISATNPIFVNEISSPPLHTCI